MDQSHALVQPLALEGRPYSAARRRWIMVAVCTALCMAAVESTIIATSVPTVVAALGGFDYLSWMFAAYLLTQCVTAPIYGRLADTFGRKRVLIAAVLVFLLGTILCSLSWDMFALIGFRAVQGIGAGGIIPTGMAIVADIYSPEERGKVQGYLNGLWGSAAVAGPLLGAFLTEHFGWSAVFWINVPLGCSAQAILFISYRDKGVGPRHPIDFAGASLLVVGLGALMLVVVQAAQLGVPAITFLLSVAVIFLIALAFHEKRVDQPILPLDIWRNPVISAANLCSFSGGCIIMGVTVFVPTYVQAVMGQSAVTAGFALTINALAWMFSGVTAGWLMASLSYRTVSVSGASIALLGAIVLIGLNPSAGPAWAACGAALVGLGLGFSNTTWLVAAQNATRPEERGASAAASLFSRTLGQALGAAVLGGILNLGLPGRGQSRDLVEQLVEPSLRGCLSTSVLADSTRAVANSLRNVFVLTACSAVAAILLSLRLPHTTTAADEAAAKSVGAEKVTGANKHPDLLLGRR